MKKIVVDFIGIINKLFKILDNKQKKKSIIIFIMMTISSFLELLGVSIMIPFLQLLMDYDELKGKWYIKCLFKIYPSLSFFSLLCLLTVIFIFVYIFKNAFILYTTFFQTKFSTEFAKDNSIRMLRAYMKRPYEFFTNTNSSIILRGIGGDVNGTYRVLENIYGVISDLLNILLISSFLFYIDWMIAIFAIGVAIICLVFVVVFFKGKMKKAGRESRDASAAKSLCSYQTIMGIKEITVMNRRDTFIEEYRKAANREQKTIITSTMISACPNRIMEAVCISAFMIVVCVRFIIGENFQNAIPVIGTFAMGAFRILPSFANISSKVNKIVFDIPCVKSCYNNLVKIDERSFEDDNRNVVYSEEIVNFENTVELRNVSWKYLNSETNVINNVNLTIHRGESVAFIGPSGAGKTTLSDIILGLYRPQEGSVYMDDIDIFSILPLWSKVISYVPQTVFLLDDSIKNNVAFGIPAEDINEEKVIKALEQAQLYDFIKSLPNGLETLVGERGIKFSGGQRQRIAIARALYEDPEIIVLDEATSALDNETEEAVMEAINNLKGKKTLIIVAHRLSTIEKCDQVYEIVNGKAILKE